ncbi:MAG TPA: hypothetical protein VFP84_16800 [Kofleriaceae bacterium]|nr:hypothetical protein [Kofleriaceae bacterium]
MNQPTTLDTLGPDQLAAVTGGGIGQQIGGMFGQKGAQWGGIADSIFGAIGQASGGKGLGGILGQLGGMAGGAAPAAGGDQAGGAAQ